MTPRALAARTAASLVIGGLCLWLAGRSVEPAELVSAIGHFDPFWLLPAVAVLLAKVALAVHLAAVAVPLRVPERDLRSEYFSAAHSPVAL